MTAKLTQQGFIDKARERHGDRYDYSQSVFVSTREPVIVICRVHGAFTVNRANDHLRGHGCVRCVHAAATDGRDVFIQKAIAKHGNVYDYSQVVYKNANIRVTIICPKHGAWEQTPGSHIYGAGCRQCGYQESADKRRGKNTGPKFDHDKKYENALTEKPCTKCGEIKPIAMFNRNKRYADGYVNWCKSCMKAYKTDWLEENHEYRKGYSQQYYLKNKEEINKRNNAWCRDRYHKDVAYRERKNAQKQKARKRKYGIDVEYTETQRARGRNRARARRVRIMRVGGSHTEEEWQEVCIKYEYKCLRCGKKKPLTRDHVVPLTRGGTDNIDNIQPLCQSCNSRKHTKAVDYRQGAELKIKGRGIQMPLL